VHLLKDVDLMWWKYCFELMLCNRTVDSSAVFQPIVSGLLTCLPSAESFVLSTDVRVCN